MKLQELAVANPTKQSARVFESYFGDRVNFDSMSQLQARGMLKRVRSLIAEHRRTPEFHYSEQNPAYLKLVIMEQALAAQAVVPGAPAADPAKTAAAMTLQRQQQQRALEDQIKAKQQELSDLQRQKSMLETRRSLKHRLSESEVQQAQVVLASQDMVDQVQKMLEQVSAMQFKDLPALVDQVKNQIGVDQAMQFNTDASAALTGMIQNLQGSKQQLEVALGVVTGQAPVVPGNDMGAEMPGADMGAEELPVPDMDADIDVDAEMDANIEPAASTLGRGRR
jgi:hypothetical protein